MLFNTNWGKKPSNDIHSLPSLIAWLETKNPNEEYEYTSSRHCLLAQYYRDQGYKQIMMGQYGFRHGWFGHIHLPENFNAIAMIGENTFGAALERALGYL